MDAPGALWRAARIGAVWAGVAAVFVLQNVSRYAMRDRPVDWFNAVLIEVLYWVPWAVLTPAMLRVARAFPLGRGAPASHVWAHLGAMVLVGFAQVAAADALQLVAIGTLRQPPPDQWRLITDSMRIGTPALVLTAWWKYWAFMGIAYALDYQRRLHDRELRAVQLEAQLAAAELHALKMQLHPHFLFNTLHSVSMLNFVDGDAANRVLVELSDLLRLALSRSGALEVPLAQELDFVDRYLRIERVRFRDRLTVSLVVEDGLLDAMVPNLIVQPLVENTIRHAVARDTRPVQLFIRARREGSALVLEVEDDGPGLAATPPASDNGSGVGLANVRARLERMFADRARFDLLPGATGRGLLVRLAIPLRLAPNEAPATGRLPALVAT